MKGLICAGEILIYRTIYSVSHHHHHATSFCAYGQSIPYYDLYNPPSLSLFWMESYQVIQIWYQSLS